MPPLVYERNMQAQRVWPLYYGRGPEPYLIATDGRREYVLTLTDRMLRELLHAKTYTEVRQAPRPKGIPPRVVIALAGRRLVTPSWLREE